MTLYDGRRNPRELVINYKAFIELQTHLDALLCKVFPTTLTGRKGETLREYGARFNTKSLQIPNLDKTRNIEAMQKGIMSTRLN
ncbi:hypothetical protein P3X46_025089 [Hevea brasiliensis]|uniref:Retrotransposon gag domain-containing protein n=1 Tax=Hevea brasiliensis TaxID=3981 RepID=A0ABQ9L4F4_HEVBR|nr:hypothetical protein P3X46_025089 [Hevea brasiliensis]